MRLGAVLATAALLGAPWPAGADDARLIAASLPAPAPVPMAGSTTSIRYWPVVTARPNALVVPAVLADGHAQGDPMRTFDSRRPSDPSKPQTRRHVGVDLTAAEGDAVVAMEDGKIVAFYKFLVRAPEDGGEETWAILIAHKDMVALYGEVRANSLAAHHLKVGDTVSAGQPIGVVSGTAQLHTEVYASGVTQNIKWPVGSPPPPQMRNPTQLLLDLAANGRRLTPDAPRLTVATAAP